MTSRSTDPLVLGIETSCDETGIGIVRGHELLANEIASSVEEHARFGGVVPEVASRAHLEAIEPALHRACATAGITLRDVDAIAVTAGPGLVGALLVGVATAKALAVALGVPVYGVNHLASHVVVDELQHGPLPDPTIGLLVSGGHSSLLLVADDASTITPLGQTLDDAAGEAFDKVARLLGLPFPGGPWIDRIAAEGDRDAIAFPRGLNGPGRPGAVPLRLLLLRSQDRGRPLGACARGGRRAGAGRRRGGVGAGGDRRRADGSAGRGLRGARREHAVIGGGVAANSRLRAMAQERCDAAGIELRVPRPSLCTDNGAMVAALGSRLVRSGVPASPLDFATTSSLPVTVRAW